MAIGQVQRAGCATGIWRGAWPYAVLALSCVVFYWDALWLDPGHILGGNDLSNMFLHWLRFAASSLRQGRLPLWNPYLFSGQPFIANPQPALFYPPTWLSLVLPITTALSVIIVLHVWLAGAGMIAWLRSEGASISGALFGGVVFAFGGYFFVRVQSGHLGVISTAAWLPLVLWLYRRAIAQRSWRIALVSGVPVGLCFLAGHTASFIYVVMALTAYAGYSMWERWREERCVRALGLPLLWLGLMLLVGLGVAAVQLLPMADFAFRSTRQAGRDYGFAAWFSWPPGYLLTLLVPNFFGEPVHTGYWGDGIYDEVIFYVGLLPLLLALLGLKSRHRLRPFLLVLGLGGLLLAFGEYGILHLLFYRFVPLFQLTRAPGRAGFLFALAAAALAGLMVTALQTGVAEERQRLLQPIGRPLVLTVAGIACAFVVAGFAAYAWGREANEAAGRLWHLANQIAVFLLFFLLASALLTTWRTAPVVRAGLAVLALLLALGDLWTFGARIVEVVDVQESAYWRIVRKAVAEPQTARVLPWGLSEFEQNGGLSFGLRSVFGYDPLVLQRYEAFITSRPDPRARTYDLLNAGYLVTTAPQEFPDEPDVPQLVLQEDGVWVYRRPTALPRAWIVPQTKVVDDSAMLTRIHEAEFDPRATALVEQEVACAGSGEPGVVASVDDRGNSLTAQVRGGGGLLVFSEIDYPGWRATVDGTAVPLVRADYLLRALCVPSGDHRVELVYDPPLPKVGLAITVSACVLVIGVAAWPARRQRREAA